MSEPTSTTWMLLKTLQVGDECKDALFKKACEVLEGAGYFFDQAGSKAIQLGGLLLRAETEAFRQRAVRLRGNVITAPFDVYFAHSEPETTKEKRKIDKTLDELIALYESDPERRSIVNKTRVEDRRTFFIAQRSLRR